LNQKLICYELSQAATAAVTSRSWQQLHQQQNFPFSTFSTFMSASHTSPLERERSDVTSFIGIFSCYCYQGFIHMLSNSFKLLQVSSNSNIYYSSRIYFHELSLAATATASSS